MLSFKRYSGCRSRLLIAALAVALLSSCLASCSREERQTVPEDVLETLRKDFLLDEVVELVTEHGERQSARKYFDARGENYLYTGAERRGELFVDGYIAPGEPRVFGVSLFFSGWERLAMVHVTLSQAAELQAVGLIQRARETREIQAEEQKATVYFLGDYSLGRSGSLAISIRKDMLTESAAAYSIIYALKES